MPVFAKITGKRVDFYFSDVGDKAGYFKNMWIYKHIFNSFESELDKIETEKLLIMHFPQIDKTNKRLNEICEILEKENYYEILGKENYKDEEI